MTNVDPMSFPGRLAQSAVVPAGSYAVHPGCDVHIEAFEQNIGETVRVMNDPQPMWPGGPVVDASPLPPREIPISYDWTFQPCGHTIRVSTRDKTAVIYTIHSPGESPA